MIMYCCIFLLMLWCMLFSWRCLCIALCVAAEGEDAVRSKLRAVGEEITERFRTLEEEFR